MSTKKIRTLFIIANVVLFLYSTTFLAMPITTHVPYEYSQIAAMIVGSVFWVTAISGYSILIYIYRYMGKSEKRKRKIRWYLFSNKISAVADMLFLIGVICLGVMIYLNITRYYAVYVVLFIIALSFNAHWLFGRNLHIKIWHNKKNRRKAK